MAGPLGLCALDATTGALFGLQTTRLREDARRVIRDGVGGDDSTAIIFCGSGCTAAIDKMIGILNLRIPADLDARYDLSARIPTGQRPVVFLGPFEHHSNEVSWRETIADIVVIPADGDGHIDESVLEAELVRYADRPLKIASFSAASNVTGILSDTVGVSQLLHRHGALAFWGFAAAAPYVDIRMVAEGLDAVFLSPHKFIGGPSTPGVLAVRRSLLPTPCWSCPAGARWPTSTPAITSTWPTSSTARREAHPPSSSVAQSLLDAVDLVARDGWRLFWNIPMGVSG